MSKTLAYVLLFLLPVLVAGTFKKNFTAPVLPAITYYLPADLHKESRAIFAERLYDSIHLNELGLQKKVLELALKGFNKLSVRGKLNRDSILSIVDFSKSSREKRLYVIDLKNAKLLFNTYVAHGRNSGAEFARSFSNIMSSNKSSLGFYITNQTYKGENGYSLRLQGVERNINDKAYRRAIVMHGAAYANEQYLTERGILGRSFGCPAIPMDEHTAIIDAIKGGSCLFIYSPDKKYIKQSTVLNG
ncbi:MAG: murein L,D-transpeptidase catalytic domain family protein [Agriterribacter sp.]